MGIQNMVKLGKKNSNLPITVAIILIIVLIIGGWFTNESMDEKCSRMSDIIRVKAPVVEKVYNNSDGQPVHVLELQLFFLPDHIETNWLGKQRQVQRPFEGTIIFLDIHIMKAGQYMIWLDNSSYQTEDYLQNYSNINVAFIKERNNGNKGWKSSDGILTARLNLDKSHPPINYSLSYNGQILAGARDLPPNHTQSQYNGVIWGVEESCFFCVIFQTFNT
jgi:hypothetical protein